jgi:hypothetical protein
MLDVSQCLRTGERLPNRPGIQARAWDKVGMR